MTTMGHHGCGNHHGRVTSRTIVAMACCCSAGALGVVHTMPEMGLGTSGIRNTSTIVRALKEGYRHIDTALLYGTHRMVADAIVESGVSRADLFITTKVG